MRRAKISVIGGGNVGASCAMWAAIKELGDVVVLDIPDKEDHVKGKMLDLAECAPIERFDSTITGTAAMLAANPKCGTWLKCAAAKGAVAAPATAEDKATPPA